MAKSQALGIMGIEAVHFFVNTLERARTFWIDQMDLGWIAESSEASVAQTGVRTIALRAGNATYLCSESAAARSPVERFLARHPDGVSELIFRVADVEKTYRTLVERGATPVVDIQRTEGDGGSLAWFSISTAFGDVLFTFQQRDGYRPIVPGLVTFEDPKGGRNRFGFAEIDHITSNFMTLQPMVLWCKEVMGFEEYWGIQFHTEDVSPNRTSGSGLKSVVLWDPHSGVKFANNEPMKPYFDRSQIYTFVEDNHGPGVQHTALTVRDIMAAVPDMRSRNVSFMPTPRSYYELLPARLSESAIQIDESMDSLSEREILVDGEGPGKYMLQIFCKDFAALFGNKNAGPFFLEVIQRKGDRGFGGGNFRALFESIEREQQAQGRI
jgi:4-hydroxyphenylpyruvate dioxygenase